MNEIKRIIIKEEYELGRDLPDGMVFYEDMKYEIIVFNKNKKFKREYEERRQKIKKELEFHFKIFVSICFFIFLYFLGLIINMALNLI